MGEKIHFRKLPPAFMMQFVNEFRHYLYRLRMLLNPPGITLFEMIQDFWVAKALGVATELNIAEILFNGDQSISELAAQTQTHENSLYRLLRVLASRGIFKEKKGKIFSNTYFSKALSDGKGSMKYMIQSHITSNQLELFGELFYCIKTGENAFKKVNSQNTFDYLSAHPEEAEIFNRGMSNASELMTEAILSAYSFKRFKKIADIGGGEGHLLAAIVYKNPKLTGILFDLPNVVESSAVNFNRLGIADRIEIVKGSFFEGVPVGADAYLMKNILHDWNDEDCLCILEKIHQSMPANGTLLLIEAVIGEDNKPSFGKLMDLLMLVGSTDGRERTRNEYKNLLQKSGFRFRRVIATVAPFSIIEAVKAD